MKHETAEQTYQFFEEARVVLSTLQDKIEAFNKASQAFEKANVDFSKFDKSIDDIGIKVANKIQVGELQKYMIEAIKNIRASNDELDEVTDTLRRRRQNETSKLIIVSITAALSSMFVASILIILEAINQPFFNHIYHFIQFFK